jgi:autophagy-related protein 18
MNVQPSGSNVGGASVNDASSDNTVHSQYKILTLTFNQDCTSLTMGTLKTYSVFTINQENKLDEIHDSAYEDIRIIERLFSSSLLAIVSNQAPSRLRICHFQRGTEICTYSYSSIIQAVKLNRSRLIVCLEESIYVHNMRDMKVLHTIRDVSSNPDGLCALSSNDNSPFLAYPGSAITGEIQIFDTINLKPGNVISAHESPLAAMSFDMSGTKIATASSKGTVIRIHNVSDGACLFEFRRGVRRVATIYSLAFSPDSMFLAASSNTGTIHIFRLINQKEKVSEEPSTWMGSFGRLLGDVAYYLPKQTSEVLTQDRAFATVHLQSAGMKSIIAMNILNKTLKLFVASYDGVVCVYEVNTNDGGECKQISQYLLFNLSQNSNNQLTTRNNDGRNTADGSGQMRPPNRLQNETNIVPASFVLTNDRDDQSFNTAIEERSLPSLSSAPQGDNQ